MIRLLDRILKIANGFVIGLGVVALGILPLIIFYDVAARFLFNAPTIWANEIAIYLQQLLVFLPMGLLLSEHAHIRSTLLIDRMSESKQQILFLFSLVMIIVLAAAVTRLGWNMMAHAWKYRQVSPTLLAVPLWIPHSLIPLGGFLLLVNAVALLIKKSCHLLCSPGS